MDDILFNCLGDRWTAEAKSPLVADYLSANPLAGSFRFDGVLYIAPHQADEILDELRTVGLIQARPEWCGLIQQGVDE